MLDSSVVIDLEQIDASALPARAVGTSIATAELGDDHMPHATPTSVPGMRIGSASEGRLPLGQLRPRDSCLGDQPLGNSHATGASWS